MTSEQIAALRRHAGTQEDCIDGKGCAHADEILQLLDEREALLEALKDVQDDMHEAGCNTAFDGGGGCDCKTALIAAAIAKAEAPAHC